MRSPSPLPMVITTLGQRLTAHRRPREVYRSRVGLRDHRPRDGVGFQARALAEWARTVCGQPIKVGEFTVTPSVSVGVASAEGEVTCTGCSTTRTERCASRGLWSQSGCHRRRSRRTGSDPVAGRRVRTERCAAGGRYAAFQPIVTLPDGALAGFEVLVRCRQRCLAGGPDGDCGGDGLKRHRPPG